MLFVWLKNLVAYQIEEQKDEFKFYFYHLCPKMRTSGVIEEKFEVSHRESVLNSDVPVVNSLWIPAC